MRRDGLHSPDESRSGAASEVQWKQEEEEEGEDEEEEPCFALQWVCAMTYLALREHFHGANSESGNNIRRNQLPEGGCGGNSIHGAGKPELPSIERDTLTTVYVLCEFFRVQQALLWPRQRSRETGIDHRFYGTQPFFGH